MASYIVGDIQGCFDELEALLNQVSFNPKNDTLYVAGDLVARGPKSLETLRFLSKLGSSARCVLGNHDLHLLAVSLKLFPVNPKDKTEQVLRATDADELLTWLRNQAILIETPEFIVCHAGISPLWEIETAIEMASKIESALKSDKWTHCIKNMYGDSPALWHSKLSKEEKIRYAINSFTRMRYCAQDGSLDMKCKLPPTKNTDASLMPWFLVPIRKPINKTIIFGHWAALMGYKNKAQQVIGIDTGCVWGEHLTMLRWEDQKYFTQAALVK